MQQKTQKTVDSLCMDKEKQHTVCAGIKRQQNKKQQTVCTHKRITTHHRKIPFMSKKQNKKNRKQFV